MMPWYTGKFLPSGLYNADKGSYYDQLTFPHLCALKPTLPQPTAISSPGFVQAAKFISCDMGWIQSSGHGEESMRTCAMQSGLPLEAFETCLHSGEGYNIMRGADFAQKIHSVLNRVTNAAPYIFLNGELLECPGYNYCASTWVPMAGGKYGHKPLPKAGNFLTVVCSQMNPAPPACAAALNGAQAAIKPTPACENCAEVLPSGWSAVKEEETRGAPRALAAAAAALVVGAAACFAWRRSRADAAAEGDGEQLLCTEEAVELQQD